MAPVKGSPTKSKTQSGVIRVKYNTASKQQEQTKVVTRQGRSQNRSSAVASTLINPEQKSLASQVMANRSSSTPPHNSKVSGDPTASKTQEMYGRRNGPFSDAQLRRLSEELEKNPDMTQYLKKKVASRIAKEIGLTDKQIIAWFTANHRKGGPDKPNLPAPLTPVNITNTTPVTPVAVKTETPEHFPVKSNKPLLSDNGDIECIDLDDDDDDMLVDDSELDTSVTLVETGHDSLKSTKLTKAEDKSKTKAEESSKDEIVHLLMDQIKELERFVQTNSGPEVEKYKKQLNERVLEIEQLKSDVKSKNENLQAMVKTSEDQEQRFIHEMESLKNEIAILKSRKGTPGDSNVTAFKQRIAQLEKTLKTKEEDFYIIKNKLDLVENVSNNKVKMYKEKLEESERFKSFEENELKSKYESLQKDYAEKVDVVKSLESRIPKMIEEFTKYVEEKDSVHITKEKEFTKGMNDKQKEIDEANKKLKSYSMTVAEKTQEVRKLKLKEKESKEALEKKQVELIKVIEKKEKENTETQESRLSYKTGLENKTKELEAKENELLQSSKKIELLQQSQSSLNEKYKKLLQSKDKELDQAEKDNLEIKEKFKKMKEEYKKKTLNSKELSDLKEVKKRLKKENEFKEREIEVKSKQLGKLEADLKESLEKISKLEDKNKALEKLVAKSDSNYQKVKGDLALKTEEVTSLQINTQKLTKLNTDVKHQYNELNKIYNKALIDMKRHEKLASEKDEELVVAKKVHETQKDKLDQDCKLLKDDNLSKEEKINKLLDVLVKRGDHIRDLKAQDIELNKKLKEKDEQYQDLVGKFRDKVKEKDLYVEKKHKELEKVRAALKVEERGILENKKTILQLEEKLKFSECQIKENAKKFEEQIAAKEKESAEKSYNIKKEMQKMIIECNDKLDAKDQLLRAKALEHGRKLAEKTTELGDKIKEKELNLLKLNAKLFDKDGIIAEKEKALKMSSSRMLELKKGFEKQLEDKVISDINTQNNIRHELLVQQQQMKKELTEEHDNLKKQISEEKEKIFKQFAEEKSMIRRTSHEVEQALVKKIQERNSLVKKIKNVHLYKPSVNIGDEKSIVRSPSPPLMIKYSWPLVHVSGIAIDPSTSKTPLYFANENLAVLLQVRIPSVLHILPVLEEKARTLKRKFEDDVYGCIESKKRRVAPKLMMLTYCWPLVSCEPSTRCDPFFMLNFNGIRLLNLRLKFPSFKEIRLPMIALCGDDTRRNKRKVEKEEESVTNKIRKTATVFPMLTYCWPLVVSNASSKLPVVQLNDYGVFLLTLGRWDASTILRRLLSLAVGNERANRNKRKFEEDEEFVFKKQKTDSGCLMLSYCWPIVPFKSDVKPVLTLNDDGALLHNLRSNLSDLRMSSILRGNDSVHADKQTRASKLPMVSYSWPLVHVPQKQIKKGAQKIFSRSNWLKKCWRPCISHISLGKLVTKKRKLDEAKFNPKPKRQKISPSQLMLTYCWPLVLWEHIQSPYYKLTEVGEALLKEMPSSWKKFDVVDGGIYLTKLPLDVQSVTLAEVCTYTAEKSAKRRLEESPHAEIKKLKVEPIGNESPESESIVQTIIKECIEDIEGREDITIVHGVKRKISFESDLEPAKKKFRFGDLLDELSLCYSYKNINPTVKTTCLSSPGLHSHNISALRDAKLPKDLEVELEYFDTEDEDIDLSSDDEFEDSIFSTPVSKKTKCLSSPGLCHTFPKITQRSMPPSVEKYVENVHEESANLQSELELEEFEVSFFDRELRFSTPKPKLTKCLSSPGLCGKLPLVTKRTLPAILREFVDEATESDDEESNVNFKTLPPRIRSKCIGTPGLCEPFPKVTNRSLPLNLSKFFEEIQKDFEQDHVPDWLYVEDCSKLSTSDHNDGEGSIKECVEHAEVEKSPSQIEVSTEESFIAEENALNVVEELIVNALNSGKVIVTDILEETVEELFFGGILVADIIEEILDEVR